MFRKSSQSVPDVLVQNWDTFRQMALDFNAVAKGKGGVETDTAHSSTLLREANMLNTRRCAGIMGGSLSPSVPYVLWRLVLQGCAIVQICGIVDIWQLMNSYREGQRKWTTLRYEWFFAVATLFFFFSDDRFILLLPVMKLTGYKEKPHKQACRGSSRIITTSSRIV